MSKRNKKPYQNVSRDKLFWNTEFGTIYKNYLRLRNEEKGGIEW